MFEASQGQEKFNRKPAYRQAGLPDGRQGTLRIMATGYF